MCVVPIWHIGKRREALTGNSEVYKKHLVRFLEKRGYYLKASSDVEATFADCILTKKDDAREYWVEAKATTISLGEKSFLQQLGKYLSEYVIRTSENRFIMILACYNIRNTEIFEQIFGKFDLKAIEKTRNNIIEVCESPVKEKISHANLESVRKFFEDTIVIVANPSELKIAEEKITPSVPQTPTMSDAEYASEILKKFGDVKPIKARDIIRSSLFQFSMPRDLYIGNTPYRTVKAIFNEKTNVSFPPFYMEKNKLYSFSKMTADTLLGKFVDSDSVVIVNIKEYDKDPNNERVVIRILNYWIRNECRRLGLRFDNRTRAYYFPKRIIDENPITIPWKPKSRFSRREVTRPMMTEGKINFWVHRASEIYARKFWENYYMQIKPRWLFSSDGRYLLDGERTDRLDRAFRRSIYNRNLNQMYDILFWYRYIFSETDVLGNRRLDNLTQAWEKRLIKIVEQLKVESNRKPNVEVEEEIEKFDKIEPQPPFFEKPLDEFI